MTTKEIDDKCIDFAEWLIKETQKRVGVDLYWHNGCLHKIKELLEIFKKKRIMKKLVSELKKR